MALPKQHQLFFQSLLGAGALPAKDATLLFNKSGNRVVESAGVAKSQQIDEDDLDTVATALNRKLSVFGLELRTIKSPYENAPVWGVVNTLSDSAARFSSGFSPAHLNYFFAIVDDLMEAGGEIKLVTVQNEGPDHKLRVAEAGRVVQRLARAKWLKIVKNSGEHSKVVFGVRSMLELPNVREFVLQRARNGEGLGGVSSDDEHSEDVDEDEENEDMKLRSETVERTEKSYSPPARKRMRRSRRASVTRDDDDSDEDE